MTVAPGQSITLTTRRPDLQSTSDKARCQPASASSYGPGDEPVAAVDGSTAPMDRHGSAGHPHRPASQADEHQLGDGHTRQHRLVQLPRRDIHRRHNGARHRHGPRHLVLRCRPVHIRSNAGGLCGPRLPRDTWCHRPRHRRVDRRLSSRPASFRASRGHLDPKGSLRRSRVRRRRGSRTMRSWRVASRADKTLTDLALMFNRQLQGWLSRR